MEITEYKFEWKIVFSNGSPDITGVESIDSRWYWKAYVKTYSIIRKRYESYEGKSVFVKRHQIEI